MRNLLRVLLIILGIQCCAQSSASVANSSSILTADDSLNRQYKSMINEYMARTDRYCEPWRQQYHFAPIMGWLNDPNGLCFFQETYHLFYQHTCNELTRNGASWGHAVSRDLIHWEHRVPAIRGDKHGAIWSGSGVVDWENTTGFFDGKPGYVGIYTYMNPDEDNRQSQAIAYSKNGEDFVKYTKNPVIPQLRYQSNQPDDQNFRDPKVFWHKPTNRWVMAVAGGDLRIYTSDNLKDWHFESIDKSLNTECPDLFELPIEGSNETRWVLSGGGKWYVLGQFDGRKFTPEGDRLKFNNGSDFYASMTWSDEPKGRRIMTSWLYDWGNRGWPAMQSYGGSMTLPYELKLRNTAEGLRIFSTPIKEITQLRESSKSWKKTTITPGTNLLSDVKGKAIEIEVEFEITSSVRAFGFRIPGMGEEPIMIGYSVADQKIFVTRSWTENKTIENYAKNEQVSVPLTNNRIKMRIFLDWSSVEVFANDGQEVITLCILPDPNKDSLEVFTEGGNTEIVSMKVWNMKNVWSK